VAPKLSASLKGNDSLLGEQGAEAGNPRHASLGGGAPSAFCEEHPDARNALNYWYSVAKRATWANFAEVRQSFNTADFVARFVVFDMGGNKYRLIAEINFSRRVLFIRGILKHKEYAKGAWKS
jgi:mRNA interferase HigB